MKKIIFVAGGTAGHVFPAVALSMQFKKTFENNVQTVLITDLRGAKFTNNEFDEIVVLPIERFGIKFFLISPYLFLKSFFKIFKAEKIFFFGGYTTIFPFLSAFFQKKERIIIQLDSYVTRLNKLLIPIANKVFYSFAQTKLPSFKNSFTIGPLIRDQFKFSYKKHDLNKFVITIVGGSLGSNYWKNLLKEALKHLNNSDLEKIELNIQTNENIDFLNNIGLGLKKINRQKFFKNIHEIFATSDLIISRAGANTIFEISTIGRPAFLCPWKKAMQNHQYYNAKSYAKFSEIEFGEDPLILSAYIKKLMQDEAYYNKISKNSSSTFLPFGKEALMEILYRNSI